MVSVEHDPAECYKSVVSERMLVVVWLRSVRCSVADKRGEPGYCDLNGDDCYGCYREVLAQELEQCKHYPQGLRRLHNLV